MKRDTGFVLLPEVREPCKKPSGTRCWYRVALTSAGKGVFKNLVAIPIIQEELVIEGPACNHSSRVG